VLVAVSDNMEMRTASSRVLTALILTTHSNMWDWFSEHVTEPTLHLLQTPITSHNDPGVHEKMPNNWIFRLFQQVQVTLLLRNNIRLVASNFIEGLDVEDYTCTARQSGGNSQVLYHVEAAVHLWLKFTPLPRSSFSTSRAIAAFISVASRVFKSTSFLYLQYIQDRIKTLRANLTNERVHLAKIPWEKLSHELKGHPLANPASLEAVAMENLKDLLWTVSGLPTPNLAPPEMAASYRKAAEVGGAAAAGSFMESIASPCLG
jgi:hypothetical protein